MIRCIAVDDEPLALKQMDSYIKKTPSLHLLASFTNALEAVSYLAKHEVDLIFVDIQMPDLNGLDLVRSLNSDAGVIFTTAYSEYALEGFKVDAIDYLLKPIAYTDFLKAVAKAEKRLSKNVQQEAGLGSDKDFLFIKSGYTVHRINFSDILYIEGMREYVQIHLENQKPLMPYISMKKLEKELPQSQFMRVHRSYIVNLMKIKTIEKFRIIFPEKVVPVSNQYRESFQKFVNENFLM